MGPQFFFFFHLKLLLRSFLIHFCLIRFFGTFSLQIKYNRQVAFMCMVFCNFFKKHHTSTLHRDVIQKFIYIFFYFRPCVDKYVYIFKIMFFNCFLFIKNKKYALKYILFIMFYFIN